MPVFETRRRTISECLFERLVASSSIGVAAQNPRDPLNPSTGLAVTDHFGGAGVHLAGDGVCEVLGDGWSRMSPALHKLYCVPLAAPVTIRKRVHAPRFKVKVHYTSRSFLCLSSLGNHGLLGCWW